MTVQPPIVPRVQDQPEGVLALTAVKGQGRGGWEEEEQKKEEEGEEKEEDGEDDEEEGNVEERNAEKGDLFTDHFFASRDERGMRPQGAGDDSTKEGDARLLVARVPREIAIPHRHTAPC